MCDSPLFKHVLFLKVCGCPSNTQSSVLNVGFKSVPPVTSRTVPSSLFILASSVWKSLQCLISALTQGRESGHFFRLTCSVLLWGGRDTATKYPWHVWGSAHSGWTTLGLP